MLNLKTVGHAEADALVGPVVENIQRERLFQRTDVDRVLAARQPRGQRVSRDIGLRAVCL